MSLDDQEGSRRETIGIWIEAAIVGALVVSGLVGVVVFLARWLLSLWS